MLPQAENAADKLERRIRGALRRCGEHHHARPERRRVGDTHASGLSRKHGCHAKRRDRKMLKKEEKKNSKETQEETAQGKIPVAEEKWQASLRLQAAVKRTETFNLFGESFPKARRFITRGAVSGRPVLPPPSFFLRVLSCPRCSKRTKGGAASDKAARVVADAAAFQRSFTFLSREMAFISFGFF